MLQSSQLLFSFSSLSLSHSHNPCLSPPFFYSLSRPTSFHHVSAHLRARAEPLLAQVQDSTVTTASEEGPIELPPSSSSIFATTDDPTPLQVATSVLLTGAISVFLFRSIRRRAKRAKELVWLFLFFLLDGFLVVDLSWGSVGNFGFVEMLSYMFGCICVIQLWF